MKASELINDAYRFGNVIAEEGQDLTSTQLRDGVRLLNYIIRTLNIDGAEIALNAQENLVLPAGQQTLFLPDYIKLYKVQYDLGSVFVDTNLLSAEDFYNIAVIQNTTSIPFAGYAKRRADGIELFFYFAPNKDYDVRIISGLKKITELNADDDIAINDFFYNELLVWKLANDLRIRNQMDLNSDIAGKIRNISNRLKSIKTKNNNIKTVNIGLNSQSASAKVMDIAATSNILQGYRP